MSDVRRTLAAVASNLAKITPAEQPDRFLLDDASEMVQGAIAALTPATDGREAGLREAAEICQREVDSWPSRATDYACGASDVAQGLKRAILARATLARIKEADHG